MRVQLSKPLENFLSFLSKTVFFDKFFKGFSLEIRIQQCELYIWGISRIIHTVGEFKIGYVFGHLD